MADSRPGAAERAARLLLLMPLLRRGESLSLGELADAVGADRAGLAEDLRLLSMCGVPPYTPDALVDCEVDGDAVRVWGDPPAFSDTVRLTRDEAGALVAALEAAGYDPSADEFDALTRAASGGSLHDALRTLLVEPTVDREVLGALRRALEARHVLHVDYFTASRERMTERDIEPLALGRLEGRWYLDAFCRTTGEERTFRVDRIASVRGLDERFDRPAGGSGPEPFRPDHAPVALVRFEPDSDVSEKDWPGTRFTAADDGAILAEVPYVSGTWLARRVTARLGEARVMEPSGLQEVVRATAKGLLDRLER